MVQRVVQRAVQVRPTLQTYLADERVHRRCQLECSDVAAATTLPRRAGRVAALDREQQVEEQQARADESVRRRRIHYGQARRAPGSVDVADSTAYSADAGKRCLRCGVVDLPSCTRRCTAQVLQQVHGQEQRRRRRVGQVEEPLRPQNAVERVLGHLEGLGDRGRQGQAQAATEGPAARNTAGTG